MKKKKSPIPLSHGNREFFRAFYERYKHYMLYIASRYTDKRSEQEDLIQEALMRLMKNGDVLRELSHPQTAKYIELTVKTVYLDQEQRRCREKLLVLDQAAMEALQEQLLQQWDHVPLSMTVEKLRSDLTQREWLALEGKYILGYSHEELGELLGVTPENMRSMVSRARKRARRILDEYEEEGE